MDENFLRSSFSKAGEAVPSPVVSAAAETDSPTAAAPAKTEAPVSEKTHERDFDSQVDPMPVVKVLSTRGVEYAMLTFTLWLNAVSLLWILLALVNGGAKFKILDVPLSVMIVCVPVFAYLFLRRKKAELANPKLKQEPSKRRWTQFSQLLAFLVVLVDLIAFVYIIIDKIAGQYSYSMVKTVLDVLIILVITGSALAYFWYDEHRLKVQ